MSNLLAELRAELHAELTAAELHVVPYLAERITPPVVLIGSGSPYVEAGQTYGAFRVRFYVFLVAAYATNETATNQVDDMAMRALRALNSAGWAVERVWQPEALEANNTQFLSTAVEVTTERFVGAD